MIFKVQVSQTPGERRAAELCLQWDGPGRNTTRNLSALLSAGAPLSPPALDLLDIASAVYLTDVAAPRGRNERWVRELQIAVPVREPGFWGERAAELTYLLYVLTRDRVDFEFTPLTAAAEHPVAAAATAAGADCISLLSGGLDSLAGAVMLLRTGRQPLFVGHQSGNPAVRSAQGAVRERLERLAPGQSHFVEVGLHGGGNGRTVFPFPPPRQREPSQRSRSFMFMSLALAAAHGQGVAETYIFENGILTMALPLSEARVGGMSTRSTHPRVVALMNDLARRAGLGCELTNPFLYQTKAELIRDLLRPVLSPFEIQRTVSCWATGRSSRQCGGCIACLIRRLSMLAAGLPDEAYAIDVLGDPSRYLGTDAYANLVDLLGLCARYRMANEGELLLALPELLDLAAAGVDLYEVIAMYRRFSEEVAAVVKEHFPQVVPLLQPD